MTSTVVISTLYLGNLPDMDTDEFSWATETVAPLLTTFGSDGDPLARNITDVTTHALLNGQVYRNNALTFDTIEYTVNGQHVIAAIDSVITMNGTVTFYGGGTFTSALGVMQDTTGNTFMLVLDTQPELASAGIESVTFTSIERTNWDSIIQANKDDFSFVCFSPGARILTPAGPVRMDRLRRGELVVTLDSGPQPIRWIGKRRIRFEERPDPRQPIAIRKGALGPGLPQRDLMLSPNHRILARTSPAFALHDPLGALAPVKALTRHPGIRALKGRRDITWFALLLPRHEVVIAEGIAVESLYPGPEVFRSLTGEERCDWLHLAMRDGRVTGAPPARLMLSAAEARAALDARFLTLPETPPVPLARTRLRARPAHLAKRA